MKSRTTGVGLVLFMHALFFFSDANAQFESVSFSKIDLSDGLSQSSVFAIQTDPLGFAWLGTADGLNRFDGKNVVVFRNNPLSPESLPGNHIRDLHFSGEKYLYILTNTDVLTRMDISTNRFELFYYTKELHSYSGNMFVKIHEDNRGIIWVVGHRGLFYFDPKEGVIHKVNTDSVYTRMRSFTSITGDGINSVFISEYGGVLKYDFISNTFEKVYETDPMKIPKILRYDDKGLWVWTPNEGLKYGTPQDGIFKWQKIEGFDDSSGLTFIEAFGTSEYLIGTSGDGILKYDFISKSLINFRNLVNEPEFQGLSFAASIHKTASGIYLIGTDTGGLLLSTLKPDTFSTLSSHLPFPRKIHEGVIKPMLLHSNSLWYGTLLNGLGRYSLSDGSVFTWNLPNPIATESVWSLLELDQNNIVAGGIGKIYLIHTPTNRVQVYDLTDCGGALSSNNPIYTLAREGDRLWIGSMRELCLFDLEKKHQIELPESISRELFTSQTLSLFIDEDYLYVGMYGSGLNMWNKHTQEMRSIKFNDDSAPNMSANTIKVMTMDRLGRIWIGTTAGIKVWERNSGAISRIGTAEGLSNNYIYGLLEDNSGNIWASSNGGISKIKLTSEGQLNIYNFGIKDGLQSLEFNTGAYTKGADGMMAFGGINGINLFYPEELSLESVGVPVFITNIMQSFQPMQTENAYPFVSEITLKPYENEIAFEYVGLTYDLRQSVYYHYKLEPIDKEWVHAGQRTFARFVNLRPGNYRFIISASTDNNTIAEYETVISIKVLAPFWQTLWFRVVFLISALGLIGGVIYWFSTMKLREQLRALERENEINKERNRISADIHDEVGAKLTRISLITELLRSAAEEDKRSGHIDEIYRSTRQVVSQLDEIVWSINPMNDTLEKFIEYVIEFMEDYFNQSDIRIRFDIQESIPSVKLSSEVRHDLFMCINEAVSNAMKHANAKTIILKADFKDRTLTIQIIDDGIGLKSQPSPMSNGLRNMKERMHRIGGVLEIRESIPSGTTVFMEIKLPPK